MPAVRTSSSAVSGPDASASGTSSRTTSARIFAVHAPNSISNSIACGGFSCGPRSTWLSSSYREGSRDSATTRGVEASARTRRTEPHGPPEKRGPPGMAGEMQEQFSAKVYSGRHARTGASIGQRRDVAIPHGRAARDGDVSRELRRAERRSLRRARPVGLRQVDVAQSDRRLLAARRRRDVVERRAHRQAGARPRVRVSGVRSAPAVEDRPRQRRVRADGERQAREERRHRTRAALHRQGRPDANSPTTSRTRSRAA